ncbi:hypothetical protein EYF80_026524 [Liparis tanakae]|uniref:Uncharacterized protein n=1 Tax=Liparis tanakae TaxID=230148 RepID=A0A4Z2HE42_9TELE|nr:hypothetical protein EYF80_026524 [Liparis tanakae]
MGRLNRLSTKSWKVENRCRISSSDTLKPSSTLTAMVKDSRWLSLGGTTNQELNVDGLRVGAPHSEALLDDLLDLGQVGLQSLVAEHLGEHLRGGGAGRLTEISLCAFIRVQRWFGVSSAAQGVPIAAIGRRGQGVEKGACCVLQQQQQPRLRLGRALVSGRGAAGCFPVLQLVMRAVFSLQATKGPAASVRDVEPQRKPARGKNIAARILERCAQAAQHDDNRN